MTSQDETLPFLFTTKEDANKDSLALPENSHYPHFYQMDAYGIVPEYAYHYSPYSAMPYDYPHEHAIPHHEPPPTQQESEEWYRCPHEDCDKQYKKRSALHAHMRVHSDIPKPYICLQCNFSFSRSHDLKRHEYIHSKDKPFICPQCNRGFSRRDALKRHLDSMRNRPGGCLSRKQKDE